MAMLVVAVACLAVYQAHRNRDAVDYAIDTRGEPRHTTTHHYDGFYLLRERPRQWRVTEMRDEGGNWVKSGPFVRWSRGGGVIEQGEYANGARVGVWKSWDESGNLVSQKLDPDVPE